MANGSEYGANVDGHRRAAGLNLILHPILPGASDPRATHRSELIVVDGLPMLECFSTRSVR